MKNNQRKVLQRIYFGAPGTGKSYSVDKLVNEAAGTCFRTIFHPESDYASFVGCYKPRMHNGQLTYEFVPQVFTKAYEYAYSNPDRTVFLIIEELNRGNCAAIFGDLFQLLDRGEDGKSVYAIDAETDMLEYLEKQLGMGHDAVKDRKLRLPANLNILATMNTSDQSLFPMDSAFKRWWDWEYVPIDYSDRAESYNYKIRLAGAEYEWIQFLRKVNDQIRDVTESEDKQMGNFFIKGDIEKEEFVSKVMFYLWSEVCKDLYNTQHNFFRYSVDDEAQFSFADLAKDENILKDFMDYTMGTSSDTSEIHDQKNASHSCNCGFTDGANSMKPLRQFMPNFYRQFVEANPSLTWEESSSILGTYAKSTYVKPASQKADFAHDPKPMQIEGIDYCIGNNVWKVERAFEVFDLVLKVWEGKRIFYHKPDEAVEEYRIVRSHTDL